MEEKKSDGEKEIEGISGERLFEIMSKLCTNPLDEVHELKRFKEMFDGEFVNVRKKEKPNPETIKLTSNQVTNGVRLLNKIRGAS